MPDFEDGLARFQRVRRSFDKTKARPIEKSWRRDVLEGARFKDGDQVVDKKTGGQARVIATRFTQVPISSGRGD